MGKRGTEKAAKSQPAEPETGNPQAYATITVENIDPAFVYSIDTDKNGTRGKGMVVMLNGDRETGQWEPDQNKRKRFFVFEPGAQYQQYTMPMDMAVGANIKREGRVTEKEQELLKRWLEN